MERILKELEKGNKGTIICDGSEGISLIIYIASLPRDIFTFSNLDTASKILYHTVISAFKNRCDIFLELLKENEEKQCVTLFVDNVTPYKIRINNKWLFQVILLNSVKFFDILCLNKKVDDKFVPFLRVITSYILRYISIDKSNSVYLLRTLVLILSKCNNILTPLLTSDILKCMYRIALSPIVGFKQYAHNISKLAILVIPTEEQNAFLNINLVPATGLDTCDVVKLFPKHYIRNNLRKIVQRVLKLFLNNIENKDGGLLYDCILFSSFDEWKIEVWPLFVKHLQQVDYDSEFFQSLLKYWIPSNVGSYRSDFYTFLRTENIDNIIKAYVLLESRKKGLSFPCLFLEDVLRIYCCPVTRKLGLKIVSTYYKKSLCPTQCEINLVLSYLHSNLNTALEIEEIKSLELFFSQIFLHAHVDLRKSEEKFKFFGTFVQNVYKFCYGCLGTDYFEVAAQITVILWNISLGSYKSLNLQYKVDERDFYEAEENLLFKKLREKNLWEFESGEFSERLRMCFLKNKGTGSNLTKLLINYQDKIHLVNVKVLKGILEDENNATLRNTERIKNCSEIFVKSGGQSKESAAFVEDIPNLLLSNLDSTKGNFSDEGVLYRNVLLFEIILVATRNGIEVKKLSCVIEKSLDVVDYILENVDLKEIGYNTTKILEAFINNLMYCIVQNKDIVWANVDKNQALLRLVRIIQKSNMKRPVSLSVEVLKVFGAKMEENDSDKALKIQFLDSVLKSLQESPRELKMKIRRSPESRLVIHAMCCSEKHQAKPLLKWILRALLDILADGESSDSTLSAALHTIEILVSDNALQTDTLPFVADIIISCVELFKRSSWIVRNADLQLAKALIERFYGVRVGCYTRPKNVEDLFVLFPSLPTHFFKLLSLESLDDRSVLVFQFFFESQVREHVLSDEITKTYRECFRPLFADIVKKYPHNYGQLAARSYVALCDPKEVPNVVSDVSDYLKSNFQSMPKNIFANFAFLLRKLCEKYTVSFESSMNKQKIKLMNLELQKLLIHLRTFNSALFNFLLFKINPFNLILKEIELIPEEAYGFEKRVWLHNNIPFLLRKARSANTAKVLDKILSKKIPGCIQVKLLSILIARIENNDFNTEEISDIVDVLFQKSLLVDDTYNYLLNCYFKTILVFRNKVELVRCTKRPRSYKHTGNIYKIMIFVLYFSDQNSGGVRLENFYELAETTYMKSVGGNEELDNDIASTLLCFMKRAPKKFRSGIFNLVFYFALLCPTHLEAYHFISNITRRGYFSMLDALKAFLSPRNLSEHLGDEKTVKDFLVGISKFVEGMPDVIEECDGYYSVENEYLVPKLFLRKLLRCSIDNR